MNRDDMPASSADGPLAVLLLPRRWTWPDPCAACGGRGVTGERYEMPTDGGPTLLCDVICPACDGCGNGDPGHDACSADLHASADDDDPFADYDTEDDDPACPSCGSGRGWNPVQGFAGDTVAVLRVPCGCSAGRLTIGPDLTALTVAELLMTGRCTVDGLPAETDPAAAVAAVREAVGQLWPEVTPEAARDVMITAAELARERGVTALPAAVAARYPGQLDGADGMLELTGEWIEAGRPAPASGPAAFASSVAFDRDEDEETLTSVAALLALAHPPAPF